MCRDGQLKMSSQSLKQSEKIFIKKLLTYRIVKEKLLYVIGIPKTFADESLLASESYFGQFGNLEKIVINHNPKKESEHSNRVYESQIATYVHFSQPSEVAIALQVSFGCLSCLVPKWPQNRKWTIHTKVQLRHFEILCQLPEQCSL